MNTIKLITLALTWLSFAFHPASAQEASPEDPVHAELRQLRDGLIGAMNKDDTDAALAFFHTNCVVTWHNAEVSRGHAGIREYRDKVMSGPGRLVESFHCTVEVEELTILYNGTIGICFGSSDEHFRLTHGRDLNVKGRWSATLVKEDGRWLVANLHASTNLFDNVLLEAVKKMAVIAGAICLFAGLLTGWLIGRRRKSSTPGI